jgi:hypothetical protein
MTWLTTHTNHILAFPRQQQFCASATVIGITYTTYLLNKQLLAYIRLGRAMAQAASRRPPTAEARVRSRVSPCGICGGQGGTGTGFSLSTSVFPCHFHSTGAPLLEKGQI